jgi:hypothetical protein
MIRLLAKDQLDMVPAHHTRQDAYR